MRTLTIRGRGQLLGGLKRVREGQFDAHKGIRLAYVLACTATLMSLGSWPAYAVGTGEQDSIGCDGSASAQFASVMEPETENDGKQDQLVSQNWTSTSNCTLVEWSGNPDEAPFRYDPQNVAINSNISTAGESNGCSQILHVINSQHFYVQAEDWQLNFTILWSQGWGFVQVASYFDDGERITQSSADGVWFAGLNSKTDGDDQSGIPNFGNICSFQDVDGQGSGNFFLAVDVHS